MKGRKPKPTRLKLVDGTRADRVNTNEPQPEAGLPPCPGHLDGKAKTLWRRLSKQLLAMGVVGQVDANALETLCAVYARIRDCRKIIAAQGLTYESCTETGGVIVRPRPEVNILAVAEKEYRALLAEFGLTPASRSKTSRLPIGGKAADDSVSGFARKRG